VKSALEELKKAQECDPLDSTPHQLASAIYNDQYMPVESIEEAKKVLELLPYRKASGEALLEGAQNGTMSVNYGLDFMDFRNGRSTMRRRRCLWTRTKTRATSGWRRPT